MQILSRAHLLAHYGGRHFASEAHLRIQVLPVPVTGAGDPRELFAGYHGELLVLCVQGGCSVRTKDGSNQLDEGDQALLVDGEPFAIDRIDERDGVVQLVWTPGMNPCRVCYENNGRFFGESGK